MTRPRGRTPHQTVRGGRRPYSAPNAKFPRRRPIFPKRGVIITNKNTKKYSYTAIIRRNSLPRSFESRKCLSREVRGRNKGHYASHMATVSKLCGAAPRLRTLPRGGDIPSRICGASERNRRFKGTNRCSILLPFGERIRFARIAAPIKENRSPQRSDAPEGESSNKSVSHGSSRFEEFPRRTGALRRGKNIPDNLLAFGPATRRPDKPESMRYSDDGEQPRIAIKYMDVPNVQKHHDHGTLKSALCKNIRSGILERPCGESDMAETRGKRTAIIPRGEATPNRSAIEKNPSCYSSPSSKRKTHLVLHQTRRAPASRGGWGRCSSDTATDSARFRSFPAGVSRLVSRPKSDSGIRGVSKTRTIRSRAFRASYDADPGNLSQSSHDIPERRKARSRRAKNYPVGREKRIHTSRRDTPAARNYRGDGKHSNTAGKYSRVIEERGKTDERTPAQFYPSIKRWEWSLNRIAQHQKIGGESCRGRASPDA